MKNWKVLAAWAALSCVGAVTLLSQTRVLEFEDEEVLRPQFNLPLASAAAVSEGGTFWLYSASSGDDALPPFPYDPYEGVMEIYALPNLPGQFLIGDTKQDWADLQALQRSLRLLESSGSTMTLLSGDFPELPGDDEEGGGEGGTNEFTGMVFGTNDLYLTLVPDSFTNGVATVAIHNPEDSTNEPIAWLIWSATNLTFCADPWALDADNWAWVAETTSGQTNVTVPVLSDLATFYRLADPLNDADGDGLPDAYSFAQFGHQRGWASDNSRAQDDYDGDGISNGVEFANCTDPNDIRFSMEVENNFVNTASPTFHLGITGGTPSYYAILVDSTNFAGANWSGFAGTEISADLGASPAQGWHEFWVGLKGRHTNSEPAWVWKRLKYDTVPPVLSVTNPATNSVDVPMIQLQGFSLEELDNISCDVSNAMGLAVNLDAGFTDRSYSPITHEFTATYFECLDIPLTNGVNVITLHAADLAGNVTTTNLNLTLDFSAKTNPPLLQITWPQSGTIVCGNRFTLDGQVADPTATALAFISDASGNTNLVAGQVERNGKFWVDNIPLGTGTNLLTLAVTDAAGNTSATNITVVHTEMVLTVNPLTDDTQLWQPKVTLTGTISDATYAVWVNGIKGTNNGNGTWSADNVPVNKGGTASFTVTAYSSDETQPDGSHGN